ncbi:hypothetical protein OJ998_17975 [Solirubrobacter taibaiensis]|nr:hypothetical protein [Solirubrobacter taibaiensis]
MNLPPATPHLRHGLGVGTQRAYAASPKNLLQPAETRPERETTVLRSGVLPGGIEGVLAHHTFLGPAAGGHGLSWAERASTIVYAELPAANRLVSHASYGHREPVRAALTLSLNRREAIPAAPVRTGPPVTVPEGVQLEIEHGVLCARIDGRVMDPARLDALCRAASAVADAITTEVRHEPELEVETPVAPPADDARRRWIVAGAAKVRWDKPPADFGTAVAAYERVAAKSGRGLGLVLGGLFFLAAALIGAFGLFTGVRTGWALSAGVVAVLVGSMLWRALRAAIQVSRDLSEGERDARARPWGLEAFVTGYARSRGLTVEDPVLVQRRFDSPVLGHAVAALHGPDGHVLLWLDNQGRRGIVTVAVDGVHATLVDWSTAALDASRSRTPVAA